LGRGEGDGKRKSKDKVENSEGKRLMEWIQENGWEIMNENKQGNRIGVRFIKYDIQGVFLKCGEILPARLFDNVED
jgi:hypothetical protein